jgi:hypothetical protein
MNKQQTISAINAVINDLIKLRDSITNTMDEPPVDVSDKLAKGICLFCEEKMSADEPSSRGCHSRCAQKIRREIQFGRLTDEEAVAKGIWSSPQLGGRPRDARIVLKSQSQQGTQKVKESRESKRFTDADRELGEALKRYGPSKKTKNSKDKPA